MVVTSRARCQVIAPRKTSFIKKMFGRKDSKTEENSKEAVVASAEEITPVEAFASAEEITPVEASTTFFAVVHTFVEGKAEGFFSMMSSMSEADMAAMTEKNHALGFHNHSFMPTGGDKVLCVWECKDDTTPEAFQSFVDGTDGPAPGVFVNQCYKVLPGAMTPASFFKVTPASTPSDTPTTGSWFWVHHSFKAGAAPAFWEMMQGMKPEDMAAMSDGFHKLGFNNHSFLPCKMDGPHAAICVWESKAPMTVEAFQAFIDGPNGPGAGQTFDNEVYLAAPGAWTPAAYFTTPSPVVCTPCDDGTPDKAFGPEGAQAAMWMNKLPDGRQVMRIKVQKGFDWRASVAPILPGCPEWCPATHFGYLESGSMGIRMKDGSERVIRAGETYLVPPGHLPIMSEDALMVEFSQDTTYTAAIKK